MAWLGRGFEMAQGSGLRYVFQRPVVSPHLCVAAHFLRSYPQLMDLEGRALLYFIQKL